MNNLFIILLLLLLVALVLGVTLSSCNNETFSNTEKSLCSSEISIEEVSKMYVDVFNQVLK